MNSDENEVEQLRNTKDKGLTPGQQKVMQNIIEKEQKIMSEQKTNSTNETSNPNTGNVQ